MSMRAMVAVALAASALTLGPAARAQTNPPPNPADVGRPGGTVNVPVPAPPPADQPLITRIPQPALSVEGGGGVLGYISGTARLGPAWNVRVTGTFNPRWAVEGNYTGAANSRADNTGTLTYTGLDAQARFNILRADQAPLQPFVTAGLGYAGWFGPGGDRAALTTPFGVGADRMLTERIKVGARLNVRPAFFDNLGYGTETSPPSGGTWSLVGNVGGAF